MEVIFTHASDPVVWMRAARAVLFLIAAVVMFMEPMACGGRNRVLHRSLSALFLFSAYHSLQLAEARATVLIKTPQVLSTVDLTLSETLLTLAVLVVLARLFYEAFKWKQLNRIHKQRTCNECAKFQGE